ncbi:MAG: bifunctional oligoribonuclease/PAP phosphatase NrnA [FCB group bacterium]|nr:bifunctional oligoribonuclease/PAP phosphatase NrnA [FCB group bacterium]
MPQKSTIGWAGLTKLIREAHKIVLTTHIHPDGDGLGCEVALYHHLKSMGKECRILNISPVPHQYDFLNDGGIIEYFTEKDRPWVAEADLGVILDVGDANRIGNFSADLLSNAVTVSIDHHPVKPEQPFTYLINDLQAPATGTLLWEYLRQVNEEPRLPTGIADALYTALVTDTGSFRYSNTNERAHAMAIDLIRSGTVPHRIHRHIYENRRMPEVRLLGEVIQHLKFACDGRVAHFRITAETLAKCSAIPGDVDGFTDYARSIEGVEVSFMLLEVSPVMTRLNFRSMGNITVNDVAKHYGGGGHKFAAGATIGHKSLDEIEAEVIGLLTQKLTVLS